ncbi:MAG TPA: hypothetical protein VGL70_13310 [Candidatus Binatia bacterium]
MNPASVWQLRLDVVWVLVLLRILTAGRRGEPKPEVHLFLGDRYWRLADYHTEKGSKRKAVRLREKAKHHLRLGDWQPPLPPAVAMAMPVPQRPTFTQAIGWRVRERPPDDAA